MRTFLALILVVATAIGSELPDLGSIPMTRTQGSQHYLLPVEVEGEPFSFLVDSGAGMDVVISLETATQLGKSDGEESKGQGAGGGVRMRRVKVDQLKLGKTGPSVSPRAAYAVDLSHGRVKVDGELVAPDGLVGVGLLKQTNAIIDTRHGNLLLPPADSPQDAYLNTQEGNTTIRVPMVEGVHGFAFVDIALGDETYAFLVDIGSGTNSLEPSIAKKLGLKLSEESRDIPGAGTRKARGVRRATAESPVIGGILRLPSMQFEVHSLAKQIQPPSGRKLGGILGSRTLGSLGARVDFGSYHILTPKIITIPRTR
ncbi:hypothetical protein HAHE_20970 [Haloferula helveola]|uniref:Aspartyl protease n=1 Tax=Haloferula helveola TaxID=490095 RepID=A0ABM7RLY9_9BACT|nr:hypothetical protein HAHE_20970 [Haloferula helveola]